MSRHTSRPGTQARTSPRPSGRRNRRGRKSCWPSGTRCRGRTRRRGTAGCRAGNWRASRHFCAGSETRKMALNGICCASRLAATASGPNSKQRRGRDALPVAVEPALADAHDGAGQPEAEHREAHHQRAEMRPAADREDPHDADLQRDHRAGVEADREVERRRRRRSRPDAGCSGWAAVIERSRWQAQAIAWSRRLRRENASNHTSL